MDAPDARRWWTAPSKANFEARAHCIETLYSGYEVRRHPRTRAHAHPHARKHAQVGGAHVDGALTLPENIADFGGVKLAYTAMSQRYRWVCVWGGGEGGTGFKHARMRACVHAYVWCVGACVCVCVRVCA